MKNKILYQDELHTVIDISTKKHYNCQTIFDTEDYPKLSLYHWIIDVDKYRVRVRSASGIAISRIIMDAPSDKEVDHRNGNGLINCKSNLRICSHIVNMQNITSSNVTGVSKVRSKWRAKITYKGTRIHLGYFSSKEEAITIYNKYREAITEFITKQEEIPLP